MMTHDALYAWLFRRGVRGAGRAAMYSTRNEILPCVRTTTEHGLQWWADPTSYVDQQILRHGYFERHVLDALLDHLPPSGVYWDIGANSGLHATTVKRLRPDVRVVAFEPAPATFTRLQRNVLGNSLEVDMWPLALGAESGYQQLSIVERGHSGIASLRPWRDITYDATIPCRVETGDALVSGGSLSPPDVMKVDVEGFEAEVFRGMLNILENVVCLVFEAQTEGEHAAALAGFDVRLVDGATYEWLAIRPTA